MGGGGNRPKNHVQAHYVTVRDRQRQCIQYFALDEKGSLRFVDGLPMLIREVPYNVPQVQYPEDRTVTTPALDVPEARFTADAPGDVNFGLDGCDDGFGLFEDQGFEYDFKGPEWM